METAGGLAPQSPITVVRTGAGATPTPPLCEPADMSPVQRSLEPLSEVGLLKASRTELSPQVRRVEDVYERTARRLARAGAGNSQNSENEELASGLVRTVESPACGVGGSLESNVPQVFARSVDVGGASAAAASDLTGTLRAERSRAGDVEAEPLSPRVRRERASIYPRVRGTFVRSQS